MKDQEIIDLFHSDLSLAEVRKVSACRHGTIVRLWTRTFGEAAVAERKRINYRNSKLGDKNPMKGSLLDKHPNWINSDRISDTRGYVRVRAPDWYKGTVDLSGYAREHVIVYCYSRGITEVPKGFVVHHLDMDKQNNDPRNLVMLTIGDHSILHSWINSLSAETIPQGSRLNGSKPKRTAPMATGDDIVRST